MVIYTYMYVIYIVYTVGRSIADTSELRRHVHQGAKHRSKYTAEVVYRGYRSTYRIIYYLYSTVSVQQMNLLPENASQNHPIFPKSLYRIYQTTSQCLSSYGCAIIVLYNGIFTIGYNNVGKSI